MNLITRIAFTFAVFLAPAVASATEGKVIAYQPSCGYLLIQADKGYLLLKQQGTSAYTPKKGDRVEGFFLENRGISHLHKVPASETLWVYNESTWLTKDQAQNKYKEKCGS